MVRLRSEIARMFAAACCFLHMLAAIVNGVEAQASPRCADLPTIADLLKSDPALSLTQAWAENTLSNILLDVEYLNFTLIVGNDDVVRDGLLRWDNLTDVQHSNIGKGDLQTIGGHGLFEGAYTVENFTSVPSINSVLGEVMSEDYTMRIFNDSTGDLYIQGVIPGESPARIIDVREACNGWMYVWDKMLVPAGNASQFYAKYLETVPKNSANAADLAPLVDYKEPQSSLIFTEGSHCSLTIPAAVEKKSRGEKLGSLRWAQIWNETGLLGALSKSPLAATVFVPLDPTPLAGSSIDTDRTTALYNMLPGSYCPDELAKSGRVNTMLGELTNRNLPIYFTNDTGKITLGGAFGNATVVDKMTICQAVVIFIDVPLLLPPSVANQAIPAPDTFPKRVDRHIKCIAPDFFLVGDFVDVDSPLGEESNASKDRDASSSSSSSSTSSSNALAIGLGVGLGCAALVLVATALYIILLPRRRREQQAQKEESAFAAGNQTGPGQSDETKGSVSMHYATTGDGYTVVPLSLVAPGLGEARGFGAPGTIATWSSAPSSSFFRSLAAGAYSDRNASHYTARIEDTTPVPDTEQSWSLPSSPSNSAPVPAVAAAPSARPMASSVSGGTGHRTASTEASDVDLWEIDEADVEIVCDATGHPVILGKGTFGAVYRGVLRGVQPTAIKIINMSVRDNGSGAEAALRREAAILKHVNRDRNIVQLYGTSHVEGKLLLLTELLEGGDLRCALDTPNLARMMAWNFKGKRIALDIARGLTALHAVNVIHRDLKSKNVLLTENFNAKIADVGIAAVIPHSKSYLTPSGGHLIGTLAWCAPEVLMNKRCNEKIDIFSLGIVLWEIATGRVPARGFTELPEPSSECPAELVALIRDCLHEDPRKRPSAKEVYERILKTPPLQRV